MVGIMRKVIRHATEAVVVFLIIIFLPGLPPPLEFSEFRFKPSMPLEGQLAPKQHNTVEKGEHMFEGKIKGPESLAVFNGEIYSGIHGGEIVKFVNDRIVPVVKIGKPCYGFFEEEKCGRPLGLKFDSKGNLFVADAYYGIFKVDVKKRAYTQLVTMDEPINGKKPRFPNSVDVGSDGTVYWSDSSTIIDLQNGAFSVLGDKSGRLIKYNPVTKTNEVLMDGIRFANGICLSAKEDYILVSETLGFRVLRYYLKGPKAGKSDLFIDGLPGTPDNIKPNAEDGYFISLITHRDKDTFDLIGFLGKFPILQKFLARAFMLIELSFAMVESVIPNIYTKKVVHWIGHFESLSGAVPNGARVLEVDNMGRVVGSLHCLDGSLTSISDIDFLDRSYYFGSPYNEYLGRVTVLRPIHVKKADAELPGGVKGS